MRWPCVRHRRDDTYSVWVGKSEGKSPLGTSGVGCEVITEIEWSAVERISGSCQNGNKTSGSKIADRIAQTAEKM